MGEFEEKLNAILSSPETMEQIAALADSLSGGSPPAGEEHAAPAAKPGGGAPDLAGLGSLLSGLDPGMIGKVLPLLREYQSGGDEKAALLAALKPFLRPESQERVEKAIRITRLSKVIRASMTLFRENGHV